MVRLKNFTWILQTKKYKNNDPTVTISLISILQLYYYLFICIFIIIVIQFHQN